MKRVQLQYNYLDNNIPINDNNNNNNRLSKKRKGEC